MRIDLNQHSRTPYDAIPLDLGRAVIPLAVRGDARNSTTSSGAPADLFGRTIPALCLRESTPSISNAHAYGNRHVRLQWSPTPLLPSVYEESSHRHTYVVRQRLNPPSTDDTDRITVIGVHDRQIAAVQNRTRRFTKRLPRQNAAGRIWFSKADRHNTVSASVEPNSVH